MNRAATAPGGTRPADGSGPAVLVLVAVLSAAAALPFGGAFDGWTFLVSVALAALAVAGVSVVATRQSWLLGESVGALVAAFVVAGIVAVGFRPGKLLGGAVHGWSVLLSVAPPADFAGDLRAVPFAATFLGAALGCELARNTRQVLLPALGPLITLVIAILFSPEEHGLALVAGCVVTIGWLVLLRLRHDAVGIGGSAVSHKAQMRLVATPVVLAGVLVGALLAGPRLPGAGANERFDLRQVQSNPFDPLDTPSPLVTFKANLLEGRKDQTVFEVDGEQQVIRFPVATLSIFDGVVWSVADGSRGRQADDFQPVSTKMPASPYPAPGAEVELSFTIREWCRNDGFCDPWLPRAGWVTSIVAEDEMAMARSEPPEFRLNVGTGTIAVNGGLRDGDRYTVRSRPVLEGSDVEASSAVLVGAPSDHTQLAGELPSIVNSLGDITEGSSEGFSLVLRVQDWLVNKGFYDNDVRPGHSNGKINEFLRDVDALQGYGEQYAAAAAVMVRSAGMPARIVVGYQIDDDRWAGGSAEVLAGDIAAWIEVLLKDKGWVAIDVTPDPERRYEEEHPDVKEETVAIPDPPPPPPTLVPSTTIPHEVFKEDAEEAGDDEETADGRILGVPPSLAIAGAAAGSPLVIFAGFVGIVALLKVRRRTRRRRGPPSRQVLGAWGELRDRFAEAGLRGGAADTPNESVTAMARAASAGEIGVDVDRLRSLADAADYAAYGPVEAEAALAERSWQVEQAAVGELRGNFSLRKRVMMLASPRQFRRRRRGVAGSWRRRTGGRIRRRPRRSG